MNIVVIVPIKSSDAHKTYWHKLVNYFDTRGITVVLAVNGPGSSAATRILLSLEPFSLALPLNCGDVANPYIARNSALHVMFEGKSSNPDYAVLIDADCMPADDYLEQLEDLIKTDTGSMLIAGRTLTKVPKGSKHFEWLGDTFECYDGFTPPKHTVGSNMIIGREVFHKVGPMRDTEVSGGDGIYGIEFTKKGGEVTVGSKLIVRKLITGMTLRVIIEKQFRRACCFPPEMVGDADSVVRELNRVLRDLTVYCDFGLEDIREDYPIIVDRLFKLMMNLGKLTHHLDKES